MSTITHSLERFTTVLNHISIGEPGGIPLNVLEHTHGIIFIRNVHAGSIKEASTPGIFIRRTDDGFSHPICIHFLEGVYHKSSFLDGCIDALLLVNDEEACKALEACGQVGFIPEGYALKPGSVVGGDEIASHKSSALSTVTFAYYYARGFCFPLNLENVVLQLRPSSNEKFYHSKNASNLANLLKPDPLQQAIGFSTTPHGSDLLRRVELQLEEMFRLAPLKGSSSSTTTKGIKNDEETSGVGVVKNNNSEEIGSTTSFNFSTS